MPLRSLHDTASTFGKNVSNHIGIGIEYFGEKDLRYKKIAPLWSLDDAASTIGKKYQPA